MASQSQAWIRQPGSGDYELGDGPEDDLGPEEPDGERDSPGPRSPRRRPAELARSAGARASGTATETATQTRRLLRGKRPVTLAGFVLGMVGYAVAINLIHGGPAQVKGWFGAKFLNKAYTPTTSSAAAKPSSAATSPGAPSTSGLATVTPIGVVAPSGSAA